MNNKKVFFPIGAFFPSQIGGPCNTLYWHTCALTRNGLEVSIVTTTVGIQEGKVETDKVLKKECGSVYYGKGNARRLKTILHALKEIKKAEVLHLNSLFNFLSIVCFFYARIFFPGKCIIWSVRGELSPQALKFGRTKKLFLLAFYKRMTKKVHFHATSKVEAEDIKKMFGEGNAVYLPNLIQPAEKKNLEVKKQLLFLGRIHPIKAIHKLLEGLSLSEAFLKQEFKMILVGTFENRHEFYYKELLMLIEQLNLKERVEFKGHLTGDEKEAIISQSYALILPSETENFGNVVVEALNQGTPVIASKNTPWSILEERACGLHIENSPQQIANAIDKFLNLNQIDYLEFRKNASTLIDAEFNVNNKIKNWITIYNSIEC